MFLKVYKYRVLLFGLINGLAIYQHYINDVLFEYLNDFCQTYLDNILIYSKFRKEYVIYVCQVLQKLRKVGLQIDILKCEFYIQKIKFLNLLVLIYDLRVNSDKVNAVKNWTIPINLKQIQIFLKFCNFYYRFIKDFSKMTKFLIKLTYKNMLFL